jgi:hypothetical protein
MKSLEETIKPFINGILIVAFVVFAVSWGFWKYQYSDIDTIPVTFLVITTSRPLASKGVLPEQRRKFALEFGERLKTEDADATITTTGDLHTSLLMKSRIINEQFAFQMKKNTEVINDIRTMGFKRLIMYDGRTAWVVKFKN